MKKKEYVKKGMHTKLVKLRRKVFFKYGLTDPLGSALQMHGHGIGMAIGHLLF